MDGKTVAIGVLVVSAVLLSGIVVSGVRQEAYAQGGVYATYLAVTANVQPDSANFAVLDTEARRLLFYKVEPGRWTLEPGVGRMLATDFQHKAP
jgi:hypothetical protein